MRATHAVGTELYRTLGIVTQTRRHPDVLVRHCARHVLRHTGKMTLRMIQEVEQEVIGKRPNHSSIINSVNDVEIDGDIYVEVLGVYADIIKRYRPNTGWIRIERSDVDNHTE